ncbi:MAG TPA: adenylate/guanylate cyclase domain-containing protein [Verrucomicrobiaceae bacterium]
MSAVLHLAIRESNGSVKHHTALPGTYVFGRDPGCDFVLAAVDVSRRHARLRLEESSFEIADLGSTSGTKVQGHALTRPLKLRYPQLVEIGSVAVNVSAEAPMAHAPQDHAHPEADVKITMTMDATEKGTLPTKGLAEQMAQRLAMLYDLPLQFGAEADLAQLYNLILTRVMELIPGAKRGALLVLDPSSGKLAVRASVPENDPPISRTLIRRAAEKQQGFIWGEDQETDRAMSIVNLQIRTGMYVPLLWKGQTLGVLCVDNPQHRAAFRQEDLQFMVSVAHYAAAAMANQLLQDNIASHNRTLHHLLANFSPKIRHKLLEKSRQGRLQPGGEKSEVTILMSDLRGFTLASAKLDSEMVVAMLNDYFSVLGDIIFQHDGTIDKFIGDAILAVFGSPEPDEEHALKAVRAAIAMQNAIAVVNDRRRAAALPCCGLGIGVHTGEVLHGFVGAAERLEFTVIGDTVNKASRYCDGAGEGEIVLGPKTHEQIKLKIPAHRKTIVTKHEGEMEGWVVD